MRDVTQGEEESTTNRFLGSRINRTLERLLMGRSSARTFAPTFWGAWVLRGSVTNLRDRFKYQREGAIRRKIWAPYFLTMPAPIPCTASNSASFFGAVVAILSSARSPMMRNAGTLLRLASLKRHARNDCSMRC